MKKFYILCTGLLAFLFGSSQTTYYWQPNAGGSWTSAANWSTTPNGAGGSARNTPAASDILIVDKGTTMTISNVPTQTIGKLSVLSGTVTLTAPVNIQILTISNGGGTDFTVAAGATLIQDISLNYLVLSASTTADISGTYQVNAEYYINSNNSVTTVTGAIDNRNTITGATSSRLVFNGGTYYHGQNGGDVPTASWNSGSTIELTGMTSQYPSNMDQNFRNVVFNGNISGDVEMGSDLTCLEDLTINLTFSAGADLQLTDGNQNKTVTVGRNFNLMAGTFSLDNNNGNSELNIAGDYVQTGGTLTETSTGSATVNFNGTSIQHFSKTAGTISQAVNFNIDNNAIVHFGTSVLDGTAGSFSISNHGTIITDHPAGLSSTGASGSIQVGGTRTFSNGANYEFRGATTGAFTTTGNQVRNLVVNNTATSQVLAQRIFIVNGALTLTNGYLTTTTGQLTVSTTGTASSTNGGFVNGPMAKNTNSATSFTFPVGKSAVGLRNIGIETTTTAASTFTAEFFRGTPPAAPLAATLTQKSACEYWDLSRPSGAPARVTLYWAANSSCTPGSYVTELSSLRVAHLRGGVWADEGYLSTTGGITAGSVTSSAVMTTFSPFTIASNSATENPLPVEFANVKAYEKNNAVQIDWSNLTEKDVAVYAVERSTNGSDFSAIAQQLPASNQNDKVDYSAVDANPAQGLSYYRVKATETTGKIVYSKILSVNLGGSKQGLRVYPNPVVGNQVSITMSNVKRGQYTLRVFNAAGQDIHRQSISNQGSTLTQTINLPSSIKAGVYNLVIAGNDYRETRTFIVQ